MKRFIPIYILFFYSLLLVFACKEEKETETKTAPVIKDIVLDSVSNNAARFVISFESDDLSLLEAGVCWDTLPAPVFQGNNFAKADLYFGSRDWFECMLGCLKPETDYYARAYGINAVDTSYSSKQISFKTGAFLPSDSVFEAEVIGINEDCGLPAIRFLYGDLCDVNSIANTDRWGVFIARNLPEDLLTAGLKIIVKVRKIQDSELGSCFYMGPTYPWIYILEARKKEASGLAPT